MPLWRTFVWAGAWLVLFAFAVLAVVTEWPRVLSPETKSVRVQGFVFLNPPILLGLSVLCLVLGLRRIPRAREFAARYDEAARRELRRRRLVGEPWKPLIAIAAVVAVLWFAGLAGLVVFLASPGANPTGFWLLLEALGLVLALWVPLLWVALKRRAANRA